MSHEKKPFSRLPKNVRPSHYDLHLKVLLDKCTFHGKVEVTVNVHETTKQVILNSADLTITGASYSHGSFHAKADKCELNAEEETLHLHFPESLPVGEGKLTIDFDGILNDKLKGFYRSKYTTPSGETRYMGVTQHEATDCRRSFPCWDEPAVKATFRYFLTVPKDRVAIANTSIVKQEDTSDGFHVVEFAKTPIMSTYLVAFIVGEFDHVEDKTPNGTVVRVYTPVGKSEQGKFALHVSVKSLPFYEKFFGLKYPLDKCDLIAIPDFSAGAMENWGAITFRETALLVDPNNSSASAKQWVALVVGHELAHQWFGNIVTMEWWTHLWLNEGFASYVEYIAVDHCFPEWDIWTQFVFQDFGRALSLDSLENSHAIEIEVGHPSEIDEIFDAISYSKGSVVIRMLYEYLGPENFSKGINSYLKKFEFSNALSNDLWNSLGSAAGRGVKDLMDTWTLQTGYPVLNVSEEESSEGVVLHLTQNRFLSSGPSNDKTLWRIPLTLISSSTGKVDLEVMKDKETRVTVKGVKSSDWLKLNATQVGFYRCNYSPALLAKLQKAVETKALSPSDRLGVQNDLLALAKAGLASTVETLKLFSHYTNEDNYTVWADLSTNLGEFDSLLGGTEAYEGFKKFCTNLYRHAAQKLGWEEKKGESHLDALTRSVVLGQLSKYGDHSVIEVSKKKFAEFLKDRNSLHPDLRKLVYSTVLAHGDESTYNQLIQLYNETTLHEEKNRILRSLGSASDAKLLQKALEFSISEHVRLQDSVFLIEAVALNIHGREIAWQFLQKNWTLLNDRYKGLFLFTRLIKSTLSNFNTEEKALEIEAFFAKNPIDAARTLKQALESIRGYAAWLKRDGDNVKQYFKALGTY